MASDHQAADQIDVGRIMSTSLQAVRLKLGDLLAVGVFFILAPQVALGFAPQYPDPEFAAWNFLAVLPSLVFDGAACLIVHGALTGGGLSATDAIRNAALRFGALFLISLVSGLAIVIGLVLLLVPGLYLATGWLAAIPLMMLEQTTATEALKRSHALSSGSRWRLLGVMALMTALVAGGFLLSISVMSAISLASSIETATRVGAFIVQPVFALAVRIMITSVTTATYLELRRQSSPKVGAVFD